MTPQTFRPSTKIVTAIYILVLIVIAASVWAWYAFAQDKSPWFLLIPALLLIIPIRRHIATLSVKLIVDSEHLILEEGLLSKATRTLNIAKVQDVTVVQSLTQRMLNIGDMRVETAGQGSAIVAESFDNPRQIADLILRTAHQEAQQHGTGL